MNSTFRILWFEDEITWFRMEQLRVNAILDEHYLKADIIRKKGDDFELHEICGNSFDLIIMDFKLASDTRGDTIVSAIRQNNILTDILFYSSEEEEMLKAIYNAVPRIDGIYLTERDFGVFTDKVRGLINKIVKRSEDLINLRGFVLDNSCDFEVRVKEILNIAWQEFSTEEKVVLEEAVQKTIKRNDSLYAENKEKVLSQNPVFPAAVNNEHFFSQSDRLYLLNKVIKILQESYGFQTKEVHDNFKGNYEENISQYRNAFGHKKSKEKEIEIRKQAIPIDQALHQKMRININNYDSLINEIEYFITQNI